MTEGSEAVSSQHRVRDRIGVPCRFATVGDHTARPVPPVAAPLTRLLGSAIPAQESTAAEIKQRKPEERAP